MRSRKLACALLAAAVMSPFQHLPAVAEAATDDDAVDQGQGNAVHAIAPNANLLSYELSPDGSFATYTTEQTLGVVNSLDASGEWAAAEPSLNPTDEGSAIASVEDAAWDATFPEDGSRTPVKVSYSDSWLTMRMHGLSQVRPEVDGNAVHYQMSGDETVEYSVQPNGVKEDIILASPPSSEATYTYQLRTSKSLSPYESADGGYELREPSGRTVFQIPGGVMVDANGAHSSEVEFQLQAIGEGWLLTVSPDMTWLRSAQRAYPVAVDPSVVVAPARDCTVKSASPNDASCGDQSLTIRAGKDATGRYRGLISFRLASIPENATVNAATLKLYLDATKSSGSGATYAIHKAGKSFGSAATWNDSGKEGAWVGGNPGGVDFVGSSQSGV